MSQRNRPPGPEMPTDLAAALEIRIEKLGVDRLFVLYCFSVIEPSQYTLEAFFNLPALECDGQMVPAAYLRQQIRLLHDSPSLRSGYHDLVLVPDYKVDCVGRAQLPVSVMIHPHILCCQAAHFSEVVEELSNVSRLPVDFGRKYRISNVPHMRTMPVLLQWMHCHKKEYLYENLIALSEANGRAMIEGFCKNVAFLGVVSEELVSIVSHVLSWWRDEQFVS